MGPGLGKMLPGRPFNLIRVWILVSFGRFFCVSLGALGQLFLRLAFEILYGFSRISLGIL